MRSLISYYVHHLEKPAAFVPIYIFEKFFCRLSISLTKFNSWNCWKYQRQSKMKWWMVIRFSNMSELIVTVTCFSFCPLFWNPKFRAGHFCKANMDWSLTGFDNITDFTNFLSVNKNMKKKERWMNYNTGSCKETFCDCSTIFWVKLSLSIYVLCRTYIWFHLIEKFSKTYLSEIV